MGLRKFKHNELVRVIKKGQFYFHRGRVLDYDLSRRSYKVEMPMVGTRWFRVKNLEPPEIARQQPGLKHSKSNTR